MQLLIKAKSFIDQEETANIPGSAVVTAFCHVDALRGTDSFIGSGGAPRCISRHRMQTCVFHALHACRISHMDGDPRWQVAMLRVLVQHGAEVEDSDQRVRTAVPACNPAMTCNPVLCRAGSRCITWLQQVRSAPVHCALRAARGSARVKCLVQGRWSLGIACSAHTRRFARRCTSW